jgi:hypothetical protein
MLYRPGLSVISIAGLLVSLAAAQETTGDRRLASPDSQSGSVLIRTAVKVFLAPDVPGYAIAYEYDFPQRQSVYIKGIGTVPAHGLFRFLTADKELEFRDGPTGRVLKTVPLKETTVVASKPPRLDLPAIDDFPRDFQTFVWDSRNALQERAQIVLGKYFHLATGPDCRNEADMESMRTTFVPLDLKNTVPGATAQVALLVSFPCKPRSDKYSFQVKSRVMEGRTHSDEARSTRNSDILNLSDEFVRKLVAEMRTSDGGEK